MRRINRKRKRKRNEKEKERGNEGDDLTNLYCSEEHYQVVTSCSVIALKRNCVYFFPTSLLSDIQFIRPPLNMHQRTSN